MKTVQSEYHHHNNLRPRKAFVLLSDQSNMPLPGPHTLVAPSLAVSFSTVWDISRAVGCVHLEFMHHL